MFLNFVISSSFIKLRKLKKISIKENIKNFKYETQILFCKILWFINLIEFKKKNYIIKFN